MSTHDVPGYKEEHRDKLAMGCWAEHEDGSLILVEAVEGGYVVYSVFDVDAKPVMEYRDRMAEGTFKQDFSWEPSKKERKKLNIKWTWHDKTPFPWDRVISLGTRGGARFADSDDVISAAKRIAEHREMRGKRFDYDAENISTTGRDIRARIQRALNELFPE